MPSGARRSHKRPRYDSAAGGRSGRAQSSSRCGDSSHTHASRSSSPSSSTPRSSCSSASSWESGRRKRYPSFTADYAKRFRWDIVPFLRQDSDEQQLQQQQEQEQQRGTWLPRVTGPPCWILYDEYVFVRTLGKGTYAKVALCHSLRTGEYCALKIFRAERKYMRACWDEVQVLKALCRPSSHDEQPQQQRQQCHGRSSSSRDGCGDVAAPSMPWHRALGDSSDYWGRVGRFNTLIAHVPHPDHQAIVMPILGASLLDVLRRISHAVERVSRNTRPASAIEQGGSPRQGVVVVDVDYNGMPLSLVRPVLYQILLFLQHAHRRGIVHTDLKPENILFESCGRLQKRLNVEQLRYSYAASQSTERWQQQQQQQSTYFRSDSGAHGSYACPPLREVGRSSMVVDVALPMTNSVRVIDLGAAEFLSSCHSVSALDGVTRVFQHRIQTTHYRSVEVLLGLGWAASTDIWSLGCMIPELLTGACVFMPKSDLEHLALMQHIIGAFDSVENVSHGDNGKNSMVRRVFCKGTHFGKYFNTSTMQLAWPPAPIEGRQRRGEVEKEVRYVKSQPTLQEVLGPYPQLHDLCRRMLDYDPRCRITAEEALQHPFFTTPE